MAIQTEDWMIRNAIETSRLSLKVMVQLLEGFSNLLQRKADEFQYDREHGELTNQQFDAYYDKLDSAGMMPKTKLLEELEDKELNQISNVLEGSGIAFTIYPLEKEGHTKYNLELMAKGHSEQQLNKMIDICMTLKNNIENNPDRKQSINSHIADSMIDVINDRAKGDRDPNRERIKEKGEHSR